MEQRNVVYFLIRYPVNFKKTHTKDNVNYWLTIAGWTRLARTPTWCPTVRRWTRTARLWTRLSTRCLGVAATWAAWSPSPTPSMSATWTTWSKMRRWVLCAVLTELFHVQRPGKDPGQVWAAPVLLPRQCVLLGVGCDLARVPQTSPHTSTSLHLGGHPACTLQVTTQEMTGDTGCFCVK